MPIKDGLLAEFDHEVATKLALSAQWMDENFLSDPTSLIILPFDGIKKRRLLHFPAIRFGNAFHAGRKLHRVSQMIAPIAGRRRFGHQLAL